MSIPVCIIFVLNVGWTRNPNVLDTSPRTGHAKRLPRAIMTELSGFRCAFAASSAFFFMSNVIVLPISLCASSSSFIAAMWTWRSF